MQMNQMMMKVWLLFVVDDFQLVSKYEFPIDETIHFSSVKNDGGHVAFCWRKPGSYTVRSLI